MENIDVNGLITEARNLKCNVESLKLAIRKSKQILIRKLKGTALSSNELNKIFDEKFKTLEIVADAAQRKVYAFADFITKNVTSEYIAAHEEIKEFFNDLLGTDNFDLEGQDVYGGYLMDWIVKFSLFYFLI